MKAPDARRPIRQAIGELEAALLALSGAATRREREAAERYLLQARAQINAAAAAIR